MGDLTVDNYTDSLRRRFNADYRREIFGRIERVEECVVHYFLDIPTEELRARITAQVLHPNNPDLDESARSWRLAQIERCAPQPSNWTTRPYE